MAKAEAVCACVQSPEAHACEEASSSSCRAQTEEALAGAATTHGDTARGEEAAIYSESLQEEDEDGASQAVERLDSIGNAACCLNDTFEVQAQGLNSSLAPHLPPQWADSKEPTRWISNLHAYVQPGACLLARCAFSFRGLGWERHGRMRDSCMMAQEDELEAAGLCDEMDQHAADLAAINKILGSPFVQRDAMRVSGQRDLPTAASCDQETGCGAPLTARSPWSVSASVGCGLMHRQYANVESAQSSAGSVHAVGCTRQAWLRRCRGVQDVSLACEAWDQAARDQDQRHLQLARGPSTLPA